MALLDSSDIYEVDCDRYTRVARSLRGNRRTAPLRTRSSMDWVEAHHILIARHRYLATCVGTGESGRWTSRRSGWIERFVPTLCAWRCRRSTVFKPAA